MSNNISTLNSTFANSISSFSSSSSNISLSDLLAGITFPNPPENNNSTTSRAPIPITRASTNITTSSTSYNHRNSFLSSSAPPILPKLSNLSNQQDTINAQFINKINTKLQPYSYSINYTNFILSIEIMLGSDVISDADAKNLKKLNNLIDSLSENQNFSLRSECFALNINDLNPSNNNISHAYFQSLMTIYNKFLFNKKNIMQSLIPFRHEEGYSSFKTLIEKILEDNRTERSMDFYEKMCSLINKIAQPEHEKLREKFFEIAQLGSSSCNDRASLFIIHLFRADDFYNLNKNSYSIEQAIKKLHQHFRLQTLENLLYEHVNKLNNAIKHIDEVETVLRGIIDTKQDLDIGDLVPSNNMFYSDIRNWYIDDNIIKELISTVKKKENQEFLKFFFSNNVTNNDIGNNILKNLAPEKYDKMLSEYLEWLKSIEQHKIQATAYLDKKNDYLNDLKSTYSALAQDIATEFNAPAKEVISQLPSINLKFNNKYANNNEVINLLVKIANIFYKLQPFLNLNNHNINIWTRINEINQQVWYEAISLYFCQHISDNLTDHLSMFLKNHINLGEIQRSLLLHLDTATKTLVTQISSLKEEEYKLTITNIINIIKDKVVFRINNIHYHELPLLVQYIKNFVKTDQEGMLIIQSAINYLNLLTKISPLFNLYEELDKNIKLGFHLLAVICIINRGIYDYKNNKGLTKLSLTPSSKRISNLSTEIKTITAENIGSVQKSIEHNSTIIIKTTRELDSKYLLSLKRNLLQQVLKDKTCTQHLSIEDYQALHSLIENKKVK